MVLAFSKKGVFGGCGSQGGLPGGGESEQVELFAWMLRGPGAPAVLHESLAPPEVPQAGQGGLTETVPCCL